MTIPGMREFVSLLLHNTALKLLSDPALCAGAGKFHKDYSFVFAVKAKPVLV